MGGETDLNENEIVKVNDETILEENLTDQWVMDKVCVYHVNSLTDSYGNEYIDGLEFHGGPKPRYIVYGLDKKFSKLQATFAISSYSDRDNEGYFEIFADDVSIFKTDKLNIFTEAVYENIEIKNAKLLKIVFCSNGTDIRGIISDTKLYS